MILGICLGGGRLGSPRPRRTSPSSSDPIIRPGMFGTVAVTVGKGPANAVRVPGGAVVPVPGAKEGEPTTGVYVYKDGKARLTPVRVGYRYGKEAEIGSGLTADDLVVADPKALAAKAEVAVEVEKPAPPK